MVVKILLIPIVVPLFLLLSFCSFPFMIVGMAFALMDDEDTAEKIFNHAPLTLYLDYLDRRRYDS